MVLRLLRKLRLLQSLIILSMIFGTASGDTLEDRLDYKDSTGLIIGGSDIQEAPTQRQDIPSPTVNTTGSLSHKQKKDLLKSNVEKIKRDADELVTLTKSLQDEVSNSNENVLSVKIIDKAEKIEKLAKQIKNIAKGS